jgi:acyl-CoA synthetase (AMP-forming)/AMP-acid ligase II
VGRKKDIIIRGGSNISPGEVERVLLSHPLVHDAAVFGVPDPVLGQLVGAVVQLSNGASAAALDAILSDTKQQLADYKVPGAAVGRRCRATQLAWQGRSPGGGNGDARKRRLIRVPLPPSVRRGGDNGPFRDAEKASQTARDPAAFDQHRPKA